MVDILIIGSGILGCCVARELSKYESDILVLEKGNDVASGATKANSGIVHAGFDALPGSRKAHFNILGQKMFESLSKELDFPYKKIGAIVLSFSEEGHDTLMTLMDRAKKNGVEGCEIIDGKKVRELEPSVSEEVVEGLLAKESAIVSPYEMCFAMAENAATNGARFEFNKNVIDIRKGENCLIVKCEDGTEYKSKVVINSAGVRSDEINNYISENKYEITGRKGEYVLFDKDYSYITSRTLFQLPTKMGKGVLVSPTCHGNIIVGPNANDIEDKDLTWTTPEGLDEVWNKALISVPTLPKGGIITQFSGIRAHCSENDFVIGFSKDVEGLYNLIGIESPGLTSSPAISVYVAKEVSEYMSLKEKVNFVKERKAIKHITQMTNEELQKAIKENKEYGHIVCRCEVVSEAEIREAIRRVPGAKDLDGIKRRTRAGMGRCQMGFCTPKMMEILAQELNEPLKEVTKRGKGSEMIIERNK